MQRYEWPGNVRQLENTIERSVALESGSELQVDLPAERPKTNGNGTGHGAFAVPSDGIDMEEYVANIEKNMLLEALRKSNGVQTRAAEMLKLSYRSFRHLMKKYDL